jgi:hypothetical protein
MGSAVSCLMVDDIAPGNPFTALAERITGDDAAYYVAGTVAPWAPVFESSNAAWNASVADFR